MMVVVLILLSRDSRQGSSWGRGENKSRRKKTQDKTSTADESLEGNSNIKGLEQK